MNLIKLKNDITKMKLELLTIETTRSFKAIKKLEFMLQTIEARTLKMKLEAAMRSPVTPSLYSQSLLKYKIFMEECQGAALDEVVDSNQGIAAAKSGHRGRDRQLDESEEQQALFNLGSPDGGPLALIASMHRITGRLSKEWVETYNNALEN
jgi:hypothetical protein